MGSALKACARANAEAGTAAIDSRASADVCTSTTI